MSDARFGDTPGYRGGLLLLGGVLSFAGYHVGQGLQGMPAVGLLVG